MRRLKTNIDPGVWWEEFVAVLKRHCITYDERYLWKEMIQPSRRDEWPLVTVNPALKRRASFAQVPPGRRTDVQSITERH